MIDRCERQTMSRSMCRGFSSAHELKVPSFQIDTLTLVANRKL